MVGPAQKPARNFKIDYTALLAAIERSDFKIGQGAKPGRIPHEVPVQKFERIYHDLRQKQPIIYHPGPVELLQMLANEAPYAVAKNFDGFRVSFAKANPVGFLVMRNHVPKNPFKEYSANLPFEIKSLPPIMSDDQCIAAFKTAVALAAKDNPKIRAFVEAHSGMEVKLE